MKRGNRGGKRFEDMPPAQQAAINRQRDAARIKRKAEQAEREKEFWAAMKARKAEAGSSKQ